MALERVGTTHRLLRHAGPPRQRVLDRPRRSWSSTSHCVVREPCAPGRCSSAYLLVLAVLLASSRSNFGAGIGREYRYLTDATCVAVLCLGLALTPLLGAVESSEPRRPPLVVPVPRLVVAALMAVVIVSGIVNSATYARIWHTQNASDAYMHRLQAEVKAVGRVDLAETITPEDVLSQLTAPLNNTRTLAPLVLGRVDFPVDELTPGGRRPGRWPAPCADQAWGGFPRRARSTAVAGG